MTTADSGSVHYTTTTQTCSGGTYLTYSNFIWIAPDGTQRLFYLSTQKDVNCGVQNIASGSAYAQDSSGYYISVSNYATARVYANDGSIVYDGTQSGYIVKDPNGNFFSQSGGNVVDTLGRVPVAITQSGNQIRYDVLNSQGSTSRYTVCVVKNDHRENALVSPVASRLPSVTSATASQAIPLK